jgi:hypothetical protein
MAGENNNTSNAVTELLNALLTGPWLEVLAELWKTGRKLGRGLADEGMYEVLEHEATVELKDRRGTHALVRKRQKIRYLQNNIIAYQDQAWGDGKILLNYRCSPGVVVDRYRPGQKTYLLISLRQTKHRNDVDEFNITWEAHNGYIRTSELWATEVNHKTRWLKLQVIFPEVRPPLRAWLVESLHRRKHDLSNNAKMKLPDGRWMVSWETERPRLNEQYQLHWEW